MYVYGGECVCVGVCVDGCYAVHDDDDDDDDWFGGDGTKRTRIYGNVDE